MKKIMSRWDKSEALRRGARNYDAKAKASKEGNEVLYFRSKAQDLRDEADRHVHAILICGDEFTAVS